MEKQTFAQKLKGRGSAILGIISAIVGICLILAHCILQLFNIHITIEGLFILFSYSASCFGIDAIKKKGNTQ